MTIILSIAVVVLVINALDDYKKAQIHATVTYELIERMEELEQILFETK